MVEVSEEPFSGKSGVTVVVTDPSDAAATLFATDVKTALGIRFAPRLLADTDFAIHINGLRLDVDDLIKTKKSETVTTEFGDAQFIANIDVCVWEKWDPSSEDYNRIFLCSESGVAVDHVKSHVFDRGMTYSAFIRSNYFNPGTYTNFGPGTGDQPGLDNVEDSFAKEARQMINDINRVEISDIARKAIDTFKEEGIYPYETEPTSPLEVAERQVFDVLAKEFIELHPTVREKPTDKKRALLKAIKAAIATGDESLQLILEQVLDLSPSEQIEFRTMLERVPLRNLIRFSRTVTNRLDFITGLEHILFEKDIKKVLKERKELHRILAGELWLFGETYALGTDDAGLRNVLRRHRQILGYDEPTFDPNTD